MKLPESVQVGPRVYRVEVVADLLNAENESLFGECDHSHLTIRIGTCCPSGLRGETFMHELLHAVEDTARVGLTEEMICRLAPALVDTLGRNGLLAECKEA